MKKLVLLFGTATFAGSLFANAYYDNLKNALYATARTNALLLVRQQTPTNASDTAASLVNASFDGGFRDSTAITNTLYRTFGTKNTTTSTTTTTNAVTDLLNGFFRTPSSSTQTQQPARRQPPPQGNPPHRHSRSRQQR